MKILVTNHSLARLGGTETWTVTIVNELERLGHEVHVYSADNQYNLLPNTPRLDDNYDLALVNHNVCLKAVADRNIKLRIFTSHGIIPELEQPVEGADVYVSVSEEVQGNLKSLGFESIVIRNPIDTEHFKEMPKSPKLTNVLFMSNYQGNARNVIEDACRAIVGLNLHIFGANGQTDAKKEMEWADLVIGLGRTALEAMSMGRNVIVYDYNGADGFVNNETILEYRKNNCSGRRYRKQLSVENLIELLKLYDPKLSMREYILGNNEVRKIAKQYLTICK